MTNTISGAYADANRIDYETLSPEPTEIEQELSKSLNRRTFIGIGALALLGGATAWNFLGDDKYHGKASQAELQKTVGAVLGERAVDSNLSKGDKGIPTTQGVINYVTESINQITVVGDKTSSLPASSITFNPASTSLTSKDTQGAIAALDLKLEKAVTDLSAKAALVHTHAIRDVIGLQSELDSKASTSSLSSLLAPKADTASLTSGLAAKVDVSDPRLTDARTPTSHTHPLSQLQQSSATPGQVATWNGTSWVPTTVSGTGDMLAALYDPDLDGKVVSAITADSASNSSQLGGQPASFYATQTALTSGLAAKENTVTAGTTAQYYRGDKTFQILDKSAVGLSNVDNTSDLNKPVSSAVTTALSGKQNTLGFTPENIANKATDLTVSNNTLYPTTQAVTTALSTKADTTSLTSGLSTKQTNSQYQDEGSNLGTTGTVDTLDFVGSGVVASRTGNKVTVTVAGGSAPIASVFGRTGSVVAQANDYAVADISGLTVALATKENSVTPGTITQYYRGDKTFQTLDKVVVGLANVDNTTDLAKPISTAVTTALAGKQNTLTPGNLTTSTTGITVTGGTASTVGPATTINIQDATTSQKGLLTAADWNTFNSKQNLLLPGNLTAASSKVTVVGGTGATLSGASIDVNEANLTTVEKIANKAVANGYASLDATGKVPASQLPINTGEANTASNLGAGSQVFKQKTGVDFEMRSLVAGTATVITQGANDITIDINEAGLSLSNIGGILPITKGGTGATTTTAARANLGTNDANNITTGVLGVARGGTGLGGVGVDGTVLTVVAGSPAWSVAPVSTAWDLNGNTGTNPTTNYIGTTDAQDLVVRTNGVEKMRVNSVPDFSGAIAVIEGDTRINGLTVGRGGGNNGNNTAVGAVSLEDNTTGFLNTALGASALRNNTSGGNNSACGWSSLVRNTTGSSNTAFGMQTMLDNTTGGGNSAFGTDALNTASTGNSNTAIGANAGGVTTGSNNLTLGANASVPSSTANNQIQIGNASVVGAPYITGTTAGNIGISNSNPSEKLDVAGNVRFSGALMPNNLAGTTGQVLTSAGAGIAPTWTNVASSGWGLTGNTGTAPATNFIGTTDAQNLLIKTNSIERINVYSAPINPGFLGNNIIASIKGGDLDINGLQVGTGRGDNTTNAALGEGALSSNTNGGNNVGIGQSALRNNTIGTENIAVGKATLRLNTTGVNNIAIGSDALTNSTTSNSNIAIGRNALISATGNDNVGLGGGTLSQASGSQNTAVGDSAGSQIGLPLTGANNTFLGYQSTYSGGSITNSTAVGANITLSQSNTVVLGNNANVGIRTTTPTATLDVGGTDSIKVPVGTTAERSGAPVAGMIRFNTTTTKFEGFDGTVWSNLN